MNKIELIDILTDKQKQYDLSEIPENFTYSTKLPIICHHKDALGNEHGVFYLTIGKIKRGDCCPKCRGKYMNKELFIYEAIQVHGRQYNYNKFDFVNKKTKGIIYCPKHDIEFLQTPEKHLIGQGCPKCRYEKSSQSKRNKTETWIQRAIDVHGNKYDYSKIGTNFNGKDKVCIICPEHGEFWQSMENHTHGKQGCPLCGRIKCDKHRKMDFNKFVKQANERHDHFYDYLQEGYKKASDNVTIICPLHGKFTQKGTNHLFGQGCPKCGNEKTQIMNEKARQKSKETFVERSINIHGEKYQYEKVNYINNHTEVVITCKKHGDFLQKPNNHLLGYGCPKCGNEKIGDKLRLEQNEVIYRLSVMYGDTYNFSKLVYVDAKTPVEIECNEHGTFWATPDALFHGYGCKHCREVGSIPQTEIHEYIAKLIGSENVILNDRSILGNKTEIDIYIPEKNVAFEFDGLYWHSEEMGKDKYYHLNKTELAKQKGINLFHIFEDEYHEKSDIIKSNIRHILGLQQNLTKIYGNDCVVKETDEKQVVDFLNKNHVQGYSKTDVSLGCFDADNNLYGVMQFSKTPIKNKWELTQFATDINKCCIEIENKLFDFFIKKYKPLEITSYADRRWVVDENNNLYIDLGFKRVEIIEPNYKYIINGKRIHKDEVDKNKNNNLFRIWDCGLLKYIWMNENF